MTEIRSREPWRLLLPILLSLALAAGLVLWIRRLPVHLLRTRLESLSPWALEYCFGLIVVLLIFNARALKEVFWTRLSRAARVNLGLVLVLALVLVSLVAPRTNRIFYDEDIYLNIAQNILHERRAAMCNEGHQAFGQYRCYRLESNKEPNGWPFLVSLAFRAFGIHDSAGFALNNLLFVLAVLCAFGVGYLLFGQPAAGLYAALLYALIPQNLLWFSTVAAEPSAALAAGLFFVFGLFYLRRGDWPSLLLWGAVAALAAQFRPESMMIAPLGLILVAILRPAELKSPRLYWGMLVFLALVATLLAHLYAVRDLGWGSGGPKFALSFVPGNFSVNGPFYLNNELFPAAFTGLALLGLVWPGRLVRGLWLALWFLCFWGVFLLFYAGSYKYGADIRFSVLSFLPLALLGGRGAERLTRRLPWRWGTQYARHAVATAALLLVFSPFLPQVRAVGEEAWAAREDRRYAQEIAERIPPHSMILTHNPNMFLVWGKSAAQASLATTDPVLVDSYFQRFKGGVYFHYNFWCNVPDQVQNSFCESVLKIYRHREEMRFSTRSYRYALYRLLDRIEKKP